MVPAFIPAHEQAAWRNRKGFLSQNVLGVCNFDLEFEYILAGWEGSAHDGRVLDDALDKGFQVPEGKYYLGDVGYSNTKRTLVPYKGVRHHLKEHARRGLRPANKQELFNSRHASLRNAIERVFSVWKRRFKILRAAPEYDVNTQIGLVYATAGLHNFIEKAGNDDDELVEGDESPDITPDDSNDRQIVERAEDPEMAGKRDEIAQAMWEDYQMYIGNRQ
jgi:hypothetical protein